MRQSRKYRILEKNLDKLEKNFIPKKSDIGAYSEKEYLMTKAYMLLTYAEIEYYFEQNSVEIAKDRFNKWKEKEKANITVIALVAFSESGKEKPPETIASPQPGQEGFWKNKISLINKASKALSEYQFEVINNHGIKESNILKLLLPIGFPYDKFDETWLAEMNSFGIQRGIFAHSTFVNNLPDPQEEIKRIKKIVKGIKLIDNELLYLR